MTKMSFTGISKNWLVVFKTGLREKTKFFMTRVPIFMTFQCSLCKRKGHKTATSMRDLKSPKSSLQF